MVRIKTVSLEVTCSCMHALRIIWSLANGPDSAAMVYTLLQGSQGTHNLHAVSSNQPIPSTGS